MNHNIVFALKVVNLVGLGAALVALFGVSRLCWRAWRNGEGRPWR